MYQTHVPEVIAHYHERILTLTINRPDRKNALSRDMYKALADAIHWANQSPDVRVILLTGAGGNFTSGNDLADFMSEPLIHEHHPTVQFMNALRLSAKPVVAKVRGHAVGIGTTLLFHVDIAIVANDARLQMPFVNLGLAPEYAASLYLPQIVGRQRANQLLLLGESFTGKAAAFMGLVLESIEDTDLDAHVDALVKRLALQPPAAVKRAKALLKISTRAAEESALTREYAAFSEGLSSEECKEAINAFYEKRPADFSTFH